jgi:DNA-binding CsgD family transcriptional regulator
VTSSRDTGTTIELRTPASHHVRLLVEGLSAKEIAARLHLSPRTIEFHKYQAMERIGVSTAAELIAHAVKQGLGPL